MSSYNKYIPLIYFSCNFIPIGPILHQVLFYCYINPCTHSHDYFNSFTYFQSIFPSFFSSPSYFMYAVNICGYRFSLLHIHNVCFRWWIFQQNISFIKLVYRLITINPIKLLVVFPLLDNTVSQCKHIQIMWQWLPILNDFPLYSACPNQLLPRSDFCHWT